MTVQDTTALTPEGLQELFGAGTLYIPIAEGAKGTYLSLKDVPTQHLINAVGNGLQKRMEFEIPSNMISLPSMQDVMSTMAEAHRKNLEAEKRRQAQIITY